MKRIYLYKKLKSGGSAHSFGIHVAKMAGMPKMFENAERILKQLNHLREEKRC